MAFAAQALNQLFHSHPSVVSASRQKNDLVRWKNLDQLSKRHPAQENKVVLNCVWWFFFGFLFGLLLFLFAVYPPCTAR